MSRVPDALRRAEQGGLLSRRRRTGPATESARTAGRRRWIRARIFAGLFEQVQVKFPSAAATDSLLIDVSVRHEAPMERVSQTVRTRLNHMKEPAADSHRRW